MNALRARRLRRRGSRTAALAAVFSAVLLAGCALLYDGRVRQALDQCNRLPDWGDRNACVARVNAAGERYPQQREALADPAAAQAARERRDRGLCVAKAGGGETVCPN